MTVNAKETPVFVIATDESEREYADRLANLLGYDYGHFFIGDGLQAADHIRANQLPVSYIFMLIGDRKDSIIQELARLAEECVQGTQIVLAGEINDIGFYRKIIDLGVNEYFAMPIDIREVSIALAGSGNAPSNNVNSTVIACMSAAAGDGSSTVALNTAYCLAKSHNARTVVVDMDYQFGMVAKNLDLSSPYGIKELFDHPDRDIDSVLVDRMVIGYSNNLDIIAAPNDLKFYPNIKSELIRDLITTLQKSYQFVILDLPHIWSPWVAGALNQSDAIVLVAQLWLKSVAHAARLLNIWRETGINPDQVMVTINRSGAKYKEGVTVKDFERVCHKRVNFYLPNDIRSVVNAENQGKTIPELGKSRLAEDIMAIANELRDFKEDMAQRKNNLKLTFSSDL